MYNNRIPDPDASKPDDWDEDAPRTIPDEDAVKPDGWLDDEPTEVPDACTLLCVVTTSAWDAQVLVCNGGVHSGGQA